MPKQIITESATTIDIAHLSVQWGHDDSVVLGSWRAKREGVQVPEFPGPVLFPEGEPRFGEWEPDVLWHLRREDTNKLIRTLRRARDQAYGRDE